MQPAALCLIIKGSAIHSRSKMPGSKHTCIQNMLRSILMCRGDHFVIGRGIATVQHSFVEMCGTSGCILVYNMA